MTAISIILAAIAAFSIAFLVHYRAKAAASASTLTQVQGERDALRDECSDLKIEKASLSTQLSGLEKRLTDEDAHRREEFARQLQVVREQLFSGTEQMLDKRTKQLDELNHNTIASILEPYKSSIDQIRKTVEAARDSSNENAGKIGEMVQSMMQKAADMNEKADDIVRAFRHENKIVGNWGEDVLTSLLARSGLVEGVHFELQTTLKDASGTSILNESRHRMIPDAIIHYPDGRDMYVDAKTSLTAFMDFVNAEDDASREAALKRHVDSVRAHVTEIEKADYVSYGNRERRPLDCVIMFMPIDAAMQTALTADSSLWNWAFEKKIFITSEQNLILALKMVSIAWTQQKQIANQEKLYDQAGVILDRIADFYSHFETMGRRLDDAQKSYAEACGKLRDGQQSVASAARRLQQQGARGKSTKEAKLNSLTEWSSQEEVENC